MQAVILCAGKSTRTYPVTATRPKPLLRVGIKTLLEHNLDALEGFVSEVILIVGYKKEMIKKHIGSKYKKLKITYVHQKEQKGTGHALLTAEKKVKGGFFMLAGDDLYAKKDMKACSKHKYAILTTIVEDPSNFGVVIEKNGKLTKFVEKPKRFVSNLANTSFYKFDKEIFSYLKKVKKSSRGEIELPDALLPLSKKESVFVVKTTNWFPVGFPWDYLSVDTRVRKNKNVIGKKCTITGEVVNSNIGDNCIIKGTVKNSIVLDNTVIEDCAAVENSIIGENVTFDGLALAGKDVISMVKGKKIKVKGFGCAIGDTVTAKNVFMQPGTKVWPNKKITGVISKDVN